MSTRITIIDNEDGPCSITVGKFHYLVDGKTVMAYNGHQFIDSMDYTHEDYAYQAALRRANNQARA